MLTLSNAREMEEHILRTKLFKLKPSWSLDTKHFEAIVKYIKRWIKLGSLN